MLRLRLLVSVIAATVLTVALAAPALAQSPVENFSIKWRGELEVIEAGGVATCAPPQVCGDPDAVGHAQIQVIPDENMVCFTLTWARVDGTVFAAHIHPGVAGDAGGVLVPLFGPGQFAGQGAQHGCVTTSPENIAAILENPEAFYVNIHSTAFPAGALRGQLG
ncbi:MAG TPA: CHRD domain-containing protein [Candidatus Limnocylindria bacterium]|nr:CHRD domain-containing protein [Candidatus Limnocylindria bacterium]